MVEIKDNKIILDEDRDLIYDHLSCNIEVSEIIGFKTEQTKMMINIIDAISNIKVPKINDGVYKIYVDRDKDNDLYIEYKNSRLYLCYNKDEVVPQVVDHLTIVVRKNRGFSTYIENYDYIINNISKFDNISQMDIEANLMTLDTYHFISDIIITATDNPRVYNYFSNYISYEYLQSLFSDTYTEEEKEELRDIMNKRNVKDDPLEYKKYFTDVYILIEDMCMAFQAGRTKEEIDEEYNRFRAMYSQYENSDVSSFKQFVKDNNNFDTYPILDAILQGSMGTVLHTFIKEEVGVA